jgi:hypothetical protein
MQPGWLSCDVKLSAALRRIIAIRSEVQDISKGARILAANGVRGGQEFRHDRYDANLSNA